MNSTTPSVPQELLENLESLSVGKVCLIGKELSKDLFRKIPIFLRCFKDNLDKKTYLPPEFEMLLNSCNLILQKIVECRIIIDKKLNRSNEICPDYFIKQFSKGNCSPIKKSNVLIGKEQEFDKNRIKLIKLSNALKWIDWQDTVIDPRNLKKPQAPLAVPK
uniref:Uncharacterized protein n=1 Tax=Strongyloides papillosus TaxID=174720 RepID=A0A0N5B645_STREA